MVHPLTVWHDVDVERVTDPDVVVVEEELRGRRAGLVRTSVDDEAARHPPPTADCTVRVARRRKHARVSQQSAKVTCEREIELNFLPATIITTRAERCDWVY